jgi:hypothetical protein
VFVFQVHLLHQVHLLQRVRCSEDEDAGACSDSSACHSTPLQVPAAMNQVEPMSKRKLIGWLNSRLGTSIRRVEEVST